MPAHETRRARTAEAYFFSRKNAHAGAERNFCATLFSYEYSELENKKCSCGDWQKFTCGRDPAPRHFFKILLML